MPVITEIQLNDIEIGSASVFRTTLNQNFDNIKLEFDDVYNVMVNIELSPTEPTTQKNGDIWFKALS